MEKTPEEMEQEVQTTEKEMEQPVEESQESEIQQDSKNLVNKESKKDSLVPGKLETESPTDLKELEKEETSEEEAVDESKEKEETTAEEVEEPETEEPSEEKKKEETDSNEEVEESAEAEPEEKEEPEAEEPAAEEEKEVAEEPESPKEEPKGAMIFGLRTTANREDQVMDFVESNATKKKLEVYSIIRPHGMRGYIFLEAKTRQDAEQAAFGVPYARGILPKEIAYSEIEHMLEQVKKEVNMQKNDICEIISGPFKREKAKITRVDKQKEEVVVELLEAAVPIPITVKIDAVKVIRRDTPEEGES